MADGRHFENRKYAITCDHLVLASNVLVTKRRVGWLVFSASEATALWRYTNLFIIIINGTFSTNRLYHAIGIQNIWFRAGDT